MKLEVLPTKSQERPWYGDGLKFTCTQCGNCCTGAPGVVWVNTEEIHQIAEFIGTTRETVTRTLSNFKSRQLVALNGSTLLISNRPALETIGGV